MLRDTESATTEEHFRNLNNLNRIENFYRSNTLFDNIAGKKGEPMFKRLNLLTDSVRVSNAEFSKASANGREFGIDMHGKVVTNPENSDSILVFKGAVSQMKQGESLLGKGYKTAVNFVNIEVKFTNAWDNVFEWNKAKSLYEDSSADGIDSFQDREIENIGWNSIEFDVTHRDIAEHLENVCEGEIVYIEQDNPYMFSGVAFMGESELPLARERAKAFAKEKIVEKINEDIEEFRKYGFSDEQEEALEFFGIEADKIL
jgi:hypothetical protein